MAGSEDKAPPPRSADNNFASQVAAQNDSAIEGFEENLWNEQNEIYDYIAYLVAEIEQVKDKIRKARYNSLPPGEILDSDKLNTKLVWLHRELPVFKALGEALTSAAEIDLRTTFGQVITFREEWGEVASELNRAKSGKRFDVLRQKIADLEASILALTRQPAGVSGSVDILPDAGRKNPPSARMITKPNIIKEALIRIHQGKTSRNPISRRHWRRSL